MSKLEIFKDGKRDKTICYLFRTNDKGKKEILLPIHRKQRRRNGVGGKVGDQPEFANETVQEGAIREIKEEIGVSVNNEDLKFRGKIEFRFFKHNIPLTVIGNVFFVEKWEGNIEGIEVDDPRWYPIDEIPWDELWENDRDWLEPMLHNDKKLNAIYLFSKDDNSVEKVKFEFVD